MAESPEPSAATQAPRPPSPLASHPLRSLLIAILVLATILGTLIVPIYDSVTPRVGDFPFFYFYLLIFMPAVAIVLWIVSLLQKGLTK
ncbi:MAG TPA: DUF3311 domain-containing protein [Trebonia sp.]|nr:DUF3311 domain-containing protein [Trebonia sp.]